MEIQWSLVLFTAIAGAGAFMFFFSCLDEVRGRASGEAVLACLVTAAALMIVGGIASATHIVYHLARIMAVLMHPAQGIFLEALMLGVTVLLIAIYAYLIKRQIKGSARKAVAVAGMVASITFTFVCGFSYMIPSRPVWDSIFLPIGYTGTVAVAGAGLYLLVLAIRKAAGQNLKDAAFYTVVAGIVALVTGCAYGVASGTAFGNHALLFWLLVVIVNGVIPTVAAFLTWKKDASPVAMGAVAGVAGLVGSSGYRVFMWVVGIAIANYFGLAI